LSLARAIWSLVYGLWHPQYHIISMMSIRYAMHGILVVGHMVCSKFLLCLLKQPKTQGTKVSRKTELVSILVIVTLD